MLRRRSRSPAPIFSDAMTSTLLNQTFGSSPRLRRFLTQPANARRAGVIGRKREEALVQRRHRLVLVVPIDHESHVLHAGVDVRFELRMSPTASSLPVAGITCMTPMAPTGLFTF